MTRSLSGREVDCKAAPISCLSATDSRSGSSPLAQPFQHLYGAGFPGAVGTEKSEDFAFFDGKAYSAHGFHVAVALDEVLHLKDGIRHFSCPHRKRLNGKEEAIAYRRAPHPMKHTSIRLHADSLQIRLRAALSFGFPFRQLFLLSRGGLFGWLPDVLLQVHTKLYEGDAFTFEKFSLKQSMRAANEDFAAVADHTMPGNAFSGGSGGHSASGGARPARQTKSLSQLSIG